jgi:hypothetical protein
VPHNTIGLTSITLDIGIGGLVPRLHSLLLLTAFVPAIAGAQEWYVTPPRLSDGCVAIAQAPPNSVPDADVYSTLDEVLDAETEICHVDLGYALNRDWGGIQDDIRAFFERQYADEYSTLLGSGPTSADWREPTLRTRLGEAISASRYFSEIRAKLAQHCLEVDAFEFEKAQVLRGELPKFTAFVSVDLKSCG